ncbi:serine/threonine-protein kinase haspin-like [Sinocyclocheilus grahami]|uniref:serine/threonine-protein kinase haspin-like n=1 Tax=Sinocyclocheilus grahami TaxID=75366 RepID=UPI0007AD1F46|nr:PREDICTED: serine/threonine-protein kinase haspin-like [Sinocyclocheilus grahami]
MGQGDYQFEIYRLMKKENNNCWSNYNPHSNVLWLHYLADKLLSMKYKSKAQSNQQRTLKSALKSFQSEILNCPSATEALMNCKLFQ